MVSFAFRLLSIRMLRVVRWLVCYSLLSGISYGQKNLNQPVPEVLSKLNEDTVESMQYVEQAGHTKMSKAIPVLEAKFARVQEPIDKAKIAQVLVSLGDVNERYWAYLINLLTKVVDSDAPDVMDYDAQGKSLPIPSPKFVKWAKAHGFAPDLAVENAVYIFPGEVMLLGMAEDQRAVPLLKRALLSSNLLIVRAAAVSLAELGDEASVPLIINACKIAPTEAASGIAESLIYFDDPSAQRAVDSFVPKDIAKGRREARAAGKKKPLVY